MEKLPFGERPEPRIVGKGSEVRRQEALDMVADNFSEGRTKDASPEEVKKLEAAEHSKESYEKLIIATANIITNRLLEQAGVRTFDVQEKNIRIISAALYKEIIGGDSAGTTYWRPQVAAINSDKVSNNPLKNAGVILHEMTHLKEYLALDVEEEVEFAYRMGVRTISFAKKEERIRGRVQSFGGLQEAIVGEIQKAYFEELIRGNEVLEKAYQEQHSPEIEKTRKEIAEDKNMDADEIYWIDTKEHQFEYFPYLQERKVLYKVIDAIYEDGDFASRDEVKQLFFSADFNGHLIKIGKLIDRSFGEGAFRMVGMMQPDGNALEVYDYLTKHRRLMKKDESR